MVRGEASEGNNVALGGVSVAVTGTLVESVLGNGNDPATLGLK